MMSQQEWMLIIIIVYMHAIMVMPEHTMTGMRVVAGLAFLLIASIMAFGVGT